MFTGIIESTGSVEDVVATSGGGRIVIKPSEMPIGELVMGESVAVNGCCLTVAHIDPENQVLAFDLLRETLDVTNLGGLQTGDVVNLERALRLGDRLSGHMVQGHVDGTASIVKLHKQGQDHVLSIELSAGSAGQVIPRGSIAIDGCSLTAANTDGDVITCYIIPHTWEVTRLHSLKEGAMVNIEFDMIGKFVRRMVEQTLTAGSGSTTVPQG